MKKINKNKQKNNFLKNKLVIYVIVPFLLMLLWIILTFSYILYIDTSFSLLSYSLPKMVFTHLPQGKLEKGDYVSGRFVAQDDNLGIISLRFETYFRPAYKDEDLLLFQIREVGESKWYYENIYRDGTIYDVPFFPFGFPILANSKGKDYEFRITSLRGDTYNSVSVSERLQNITAKYKFTKKELLQNKSSLLLFSVKKLVNSFQTIDILFASFVYLLPLAFYIFLRSSLGKPARKFLGKFLKRPKTKPIKHSKEYFWKTTGKSFALIKQGQIRFGVSIFLELLFPSFSYSQRISVIVSDIVLLGTALLDGFYLQLDNDFVFILIPAVWIFVQRYFNFTSRKTFIVGAIFLLFSPIFLQFNLEKMSENMAIWGYLFLVAGIIQVLIELKTEK